MISGPRSPILCAATSVVALASAGCSGSGPARPDPAGEVRASAATYLRALERREWRRACGLMTRSAQADIADAAGGSCPQALAAGTALPPDQLAGARRAVAGAQVHVEGTAASIGPLGGLEAPLRLSRAGGRWLIAG